MITKYNIIIIGGGPAGISAGIYSKYDGNNPIILEAKTLGWIPESHINLLNKLEGYPGLLNEVNGTQLINKFRKSLADMDVDYKENSKVKKIKSKENYYVCELENGDKYQAEALIICTGTTPIQIKCVNSSLFADDIHYFAYDNYKKYVGQNVIVLGSRNSGATAAIYLAEKGVKVTVVEKKDSIQAKLKHTEKFKTLGIKTIVNSTIYKLQGDKRLKEAVLTSNNKKMILKTSAVYGYIGIQPNTELLKDFKFNSDEFGYINTNFFQETSNKGIFIAGDICGDLKHIVAATGQGAKAAYNANKYLLNRK